MDTNKIQVIIKDVQEILSAILSLFPNSETGWIAIGIFLTLLLYLHRRYVDYKSNAIIILNSLAQSKKITDILTRAGFQMLSISELHSKVNEIRKTAITAFKFSEWFDRKEKVLEFFSETEAEDLDDYFLLIQKIKFSAEKIITIEEEGQLEKARKYQQLTGDFYLNKDNYANEKDSNELELKYDAHKKHEYQMKQFFPHGTFSLNIYFTNLKEHLAELNTKKIQPQIIEKIEFLSKSNSLSFTLSILFRAFNLGKLK